MKMTLAEALSCPVRVSFEEWGNYIKADKKISKQIGNVCEDIYCIEIGLEILSDEKGSERYNKKMNEYTKAKKKLERLYKKQEDLREDLLCSHR